MEVEINNNFCRCCASEGTYKDLKSTYEWMGQEEVYTDMLRDCFDITMEIGEENDSGICEVCITQLRNAANFKKQVLTVEEQYKLRLHGHLSSVVKLEPLRDTDDGNDESEMDYPDSEFEGTIKVEEIPMKQPRLKRKAKPSSFVPDKTKPVASTSSKRTKRGKKKKSDESATPNRVEHRANLSAILQYSNASPFRDKTMKGFCCLYCSQYFPKIEDLRAHTAQQSERDKLNSMIDYKLSYNPIKLDITDLQCTVCLMQLTDLDDLKEHLITTHNKTIHKDIKDIILPFRLENGTNYTCVICTLEHVSFKNLYHHMSSHYRNYCCKKCGAGYITIAALRKHGKTHFQGNFPCEFCGKNYTSLAKKKNHVKGVHSGGWLRNKCPHCPEIFVSYYDRTEHLVKVHNEAPVIYQCNACPKTYKKKFELNRHIEHHHLQQKKFLCDKCNAKFFSKRGLVEHLERHVGTEYCSCDICGKSFTRAKYLKQHMKRHEDNESFQCEVCKKSFMQKSSLKSHMRLHQDDLDIFKEFDDVKHLIDNREMTLKQIAAESRKKEQAEKAKEQQIQQMMTQQGFLPDV